MILGEQLFRLSQGCIRTVQLMVFDLDSAELYIGSFALRKGQKFFSDLLCVLELITIFIRSGKIMHSRTILCVHIQYLQCGELRFFVLVIF